MKKIIINGRFFCHRITGVERYAREILAELDKIIEPGRMEIAVPPEVDKWPDYKNFTVTKVGHLHNRLWEHISFPLYVARRKAVSLNLCNVSPLLSPGIVCIHDVKIKAVPQYFSKEFLAWYNVLFYNAAKRARKIITVSEFSKKEIMKYFHVDADRITVIPNAWQHYEKIEYDEKILNKCNVNKDEYYFSMCSLEPNKNFKWIAEVARRNPKYVFAVSGSINEKIFTDGFGFKCPANMVLLGYVSDEEAKTLMRDCKAFLFPTFYEGFGIPPLEAISAGAKQVVVSDTEVMHEIFDDSVIYVNPYEYTLEFDSKRRFMTENNRIAVLSRFSWKNSASLLKELLDHEKGD